MLASSQHIRDSCRRWTFTCQSAFVHAHLTSNRLRSQTCCQKRLRVHDHACLALPRTFSGGVKYLPSLPMVTMAHLFISVAQYNQRRASQPLNTPFSLYPSSRTFNSNVYTLSYFSWCFSIEPATTRLDDNVQLLLPPFSLNGPASIRPVRWPESLNSCSWIAIHKEKPPSYDFDFFLIPPFSIFDLIILSIHPTIPTYSTILWQQLE
jgi:hypothetical protein